MIGRRQEINTQFNQIIDSMIIAATFWGTYLLRDALNTADLGVQPGLWILPSYLRKIPEFHEFFWVMAVMVPLTPIILEIHGFYTHILEKTVWRSLRQMFQTSLWIGLILGLIVIFFKADFPSRSFVILLAAIVGACLLAKEQFVRYIIKRRLAAGTFRERIVVAGPPDDVQRLLNDLPPEIAASLEIVDQIDISVEPIERLVSVLHRKAVARVIFATDHVHFGRIERAIHACETEGVEAWLNADFIQTAIARPSFDSLGQRLMLVFRSTPEASWALLLKNTMDRVGAVVAMVITIPVWVGAMIGIKCSSKGPIFFKQQRSGLRGRPFSMWKFRTMDVDAEEKRAQLHRQNEMDGPVFKIENDPRVFSFGRFLRRWSIDELPQLINVLRGEMSLVGPRPLPVYEVEKISEAAQRRRLSVRPGLTCLWQVNGRNTITSFEEWVALDLKYIDNWSLWLDIRILVQTVPAVLMGSGAR